VSYKRSLGNARQKIQAALPQKFIPRSRFMNFVAPQILQIFSNVTWGQYGPEASTAQTEAQNDILKNWVNEENPSFQLSLFIFQTITVSLNY
jgi:hypothetical protein